MRIQKALAAALIAVLCSPVMAANIIRLSAPIAAHSAEQVREPTFSLTSLGDLNAKIGRAYSLDLSSIVVWSNPGNKPLPALVFSADSLPNGISLSEDGLISGLATTKGVYPLVVDVSDGKVLKTVQSSLSVDSPYAKQTCDPLWSTVKYYIDGSSSSPYERKAGLTVSQSSGVSIETENPTGDGKSARFSGTSYLAFSDNSTENLGSSDFTIEAFIKPDSMGMHTILAKGNVVNVSYGSYQLFASSSGNFGFYASTTGSSWAVSASFGHYTPGVWTQVAVTRQGNTWRFFQDGALQATASASGSIIPNNGVGLQVGHMRSGNFTSGPLYAPLSGYLQGIRVSAGARYVADYTPTGIAGGACQ